MEKMKQLGTREAAEMMESGKSCAEQLMAALDNNGLDALRGGHKEAFWIGMMAYLCGHMAAMVGAQSGAAIVDQCRSGMFSAEANYRKKEAH
ncbi:hypothetical protein [Eoetvoesiella caeni]